MGRFWEQALVHNREHCEGVRCEPLHTHLLHEAGSAALVCVHVYMCMCVYRVWNLCMESVYGTKPSFCVC